MNKAIDTDDSAQQKKWRQDQTALVREDVVNGQNVFECIAQRDLHNHTTAVLRELARTGNVEINTAVCRAVSKLPFLQQIGHAVDCFEHVLHTKCPPEVCVIWFNALLKIAPRVTTQEVRCSFLNALKVCAVMGNTDVGNTIFFGLLNGKTDGAPKTDELLKCYFTASLGDAQSIINVCQSLRGELKPLEYNHGMDCLMREISSILKTTPSKIGRKTFNCLAAQLPSEYTETFSQAVWQTCLKWCNSLGFSSRKSSIDYMMHYATAHGTTHHWNAVMHSIAANCKNSTHQTFNYQAVETALDLLTRMKNSTVLMDAYSQVVRNGLREVFSKIGRPEFTYSRDQDIWKQMEYIYSAFEKSELLHHVGQTHHSVSEPPKRKM